VISKAWRNVPIEIRINCSNRGNGGFKIPHFLISYSFLDIYISIVQALETKLEHRVEHRVADRDKNRV
jgi:hypothetical protein